jgi:hypothetical protein
VIFVRQMIIVCVVSLALWAADARAGIVNGSFETGDFTGWDGSGSFVVQTAAFGATPTSGTYHALLSTGANSAASIEAFLGLTSGTLNAISGGTATIGSAIRQSITGQAGDVLSFDWNFLTNEFLEEALYNDFAFWSLVNQQSGELLADTFFVPFVLSSTTFTSETGYQATTFTLTQSGTFTLGFGVMDVQDQAIRSGLLIDNVQLTSSASPIPEPSSLVVFGLAALGLVYFRRRKENA